MKKQRMELGKKLFLGKEKITDLSNEERNAIKGGIAAPSFGGNCDTEIDCATACVCIPSTPAGPKGGCTAPQSLEKKICK